ncbi:MAG: NTPase [Phycisphaerales bacterium]|nr:MAG: NTPase [Phycisphaerales bacterium]
MAPEYTKILLTGSPGCGKTTAVTKIIALLDCIRAAGFYTDEIRQDGHRKGFSWKRLDGASGTLAHVDIKSRFKVGKYRVDVAGFEAAVVPILDLDQSDAKLFVVDEIGKMECFSEKFVAAVRELLVSDRSVLATVAKKGAGPISELKNYPGVRLLTLTRDHRDETVAEILQLLSFLAK